MRTCGQLTQEQISELPTKELGAAADVLEGLRPTLQQAQVLAVGALRRYYELTDSYPGDDVGLDDVVRERTNAGRLIDLLFELLGNERADALIREAQRGLR